MRILISLLVCLVIAAVATSGENQSVRAFISMAPDDYVHDDPDAMGGNIVITYLCFDCLGTDYPGDGGMTGTSLVLDYLCGGFTAGSADVTIFHPSAQTVLGGPDDLTYGWVIAAPECVTPGPTDIVCVAMIPWYYLGGPGDILILPNPVDGKAVVDCNNDIDYFCVLSHGAIGQTVQTPGDIDCDCMHQHTSYIYCEPQGGENPTHPPTYWYFGDLQVCPGEEGPLYGFHVQTYDPNPANYTNWVEPEGYTHMVHQADGSTWVTWCTDDMDAWIAGDRWFAFDNPSSPDWGEWVLSNWTARCSPSWSGGAASSWDGNHNTLPDGYGRRVHVPTFPTPVEETSWGTIKALYR